MKKLILVTIVMMISSFPGALAEIRIENTSLSQALTRIDMMRLASRVGRGIETFAFEQAPGRYCINLSESREYSELFDVFAR